MSDTHDRLPRVEAAVSRLNDSGVDLALHAGDYISPFVIPRLSELETNLIGVFGNNDGDHAMLSAAFAEFENLEIRGNFTEIEEGGVRIALLHGHETKLLNALVRSGAFDILVHGHSHEPGVYRSGDMLVVNPGEVCGYITGISTVALLDTRTMEAAIVHI